MSALNDVPERRIGFLLLPGFALMSFASASEPFRAANILANRTLFRVETFAEESGLVASSGGAAVPAAALPGPGAKLDMLFACAGGSPADWRRPAVHAALRQAASEGVALGGISGGPYLLAEAGLLANRRFTIHWEHAPALREAFPHLHPEQARFVIDRDRLTCGGGIAPLDMMHALIAARMGAGFARRVSDWFLHTEIEPGSSPQRGSVPERYGVHHPALVAILERMEASVEAPLSRAAMARLVALSPRQVDRLFARHMGSSFLAQYRRLRLEHGRRLLRESPLSVAEIAFATGFSSAGHFSRSFRDLFGQRPGEARRAVPGDILRS
ncbi:AraC family transcriptional regulator [Aureimonas endophytica]|uniref:AraC family transcriptional regulator n=1 Tax=Aureimonas endophytica TaxID=2027858 RepID=A0A916ZPD5_9HYPH|nr:GlxA family transcriptional regulator [Aureimonas endophytica]GGE05510.1 AraC family transcriptional regulator [Aureimonas endophytica]